ncbi:MAG: hypothetical protein JWO03_2892 [Bacteroidetes bacterium]|nr:hypothetical protein [Bacteroidota bacterium]
MARQDDLFELIRSLTPSEKRYFKLHADKYISDGYKSQYEKLYDALNNWPGDEYDEKEFKKKNKGKTFLKNLPHEKNYLKTLLLKTLRNFHTHTDTAAALHEMLLDIRLLISKGLKQQATTMIERAMVIAEEQELYSEIFLLNDFLLALDNIGVRLQPVAADKMHKNEHKILRRMEHTREAIYLRVQMIDIDRRAAGSAREAEASLIINKTLSLVDSPSLSRRAEISLLIIQQLYLIHHHKYAEAMTLTSDWIQRIEKAKDNYSYSPEQYRSTLANYLLCLMHCEQFDIIPDAIAKIKTMRLSDERAAAASFRITVQYELIYLLNKPGSQNSGEIIAAIEQGLRKFRAFISEMQMVEMRFNIALLHFLQKNYDTALKDISVLLFLSGRDERYTYTTGMARTMEWMCQCSTGNYDILDSSLRNLRRYYADRDQNNEMLHQAWQLYGGIIKEAGRKQPFIASARKNIAATPTAPQWEQLKAIILAWL